MKAFSFRVSKKLERVHVLTPSKLILMIHVIYQYLSVYMFVWEHIYKPIHIHKHEFIKN